ncbi:hypothetical protein JHD50_10475 [Sulfurimonas sp. MAG313]|nr:hypothetical protein [Sulfurimonas sp. MAG313]MDF1881718.1 hypothetical protein [Sulfurimonas sp. MAG313]
MTKLMISTLLLPLMLLSNENVNLKAGQKIFNNTCSACHVEILDKKAALKLHL